MATLVSKVVYSGTPHDYTTVALFESGEQRDLTGVDEIAEFVAGNFQDTSSVDFNGWTTSATQFIRGLANENHSGLFGTSSYRLVVNSSWSFLTREEFTRLYGLLISSGGDGPCLYTFGLGSTALFIGERLICKGNAGSNGYGMRLDSAGAAAGCIFHIGASLILDHTVTGSKALLNEKDNPLYAYSVTVANCYSFTESTSNNPSVRVIGSLYYSQGISGATGFDTESYHASSDYNASDIASDTVPGAHSRNGQTFTFVSEAGDNYHLDAADGGAKGFGVDLSADGSYPISVDIDNVTRTGTWDIGADQYVAAGGGGLAAGVRQTLVGKAAAARANP